VGGETEAGVVVPMVVVVMMMMMVMMIANIFGVVFVVVCVKKLWSMG